MGHQWHPWVQNTLSYLIQIATAAHKIACYDDVVPGLRRQQGAKGMCFACIACHLILQLPVNDAGALAAM